MTYDEAVGALRASAKNDAILEAEYAAAYAALGVRMGLDVALPIPKGSSPTWEDTIKLRLRELRRPCVALVYRDGLPGTCWLVCGDTLSGVEARCPAVRMGPNGPVDHVDWIRI